jgi:hypothetical protein
VARKQRLGTGVRTTARRSIRTALIAGAVIAVTTLILNAYLLDGVWGAFLSAVGAAPTQSPIGYSDRAFRRIKKGMSTDQVSQILGPPLFVVRTYSNGTRLAFEGLGEKPYIDGIGVEGVYVHQATGPASFRSSTNRSVELRKKPNDVAVLST